MDKSDIQESRRFLSSNKSAFYTVVASFRAQVTFFGLATMATGYQIKKDSYKINV